MIEPTKQYGVPQPPPHILFDPTDYATARDGLSALLRTTGHPLGPKEISEALRVSEGYVRQVLGEMVDTGEVIKPRRGRYTIPNGRISAEDFLESDHAVHTPPAPAFEPGTVFRMAVPGGPTLTFRFVVEQDGPPLEIGVEMPTGQLTPAVS